ncbi:MAG: hypothetical protein ISR51_07225 [Rhodospirillales bacterium]|nr:hypothetical protein [Alphaproteobacteria bacterium]MBL6948453.1 hypothetical protein [Rhodospirillales bacterium]
MTAPKPIAALLKKIQELENEIDLDFESQRKTFRYTIENRRARFEESVRRHHKTLRTGLIRFLVQSGAPAILAAPLVYALIVPLVMVDISVTLFQAICFPIYGIRKVPRGDFIVVDRHQLAYLNPLEKLNCAYCGYANGLLAYAREIAGRSEAHWCPIKHLRKTKGQHRRYYDFAEFGNGEGFRELERNNMIRAAEAHNKLWTDNGEK